MKKSEIIENILNGKIFIYPTDTLYGIGCNAMNKASVEKIREIKGRDKKPFSVIAPNIFWIKDNLIVDCDLEKYLPGPYTVILKKKDPAFLKHVAEGDTLGIRIPQHEFTKLVQRAAVPFISTSVNLSGQPSVLSLVDIPKEIEDKVDFIIENQGEMSGVPSTLVINGNKVPRK